MIVDYCLAILPRGGFCCRLIRRRFTLDHCAQHGGRHVPALVARWLAGESIADLAAGMDPQRPVTVRAAYIEGLIRRYAGGADLSPTRSNQQE